MGENAIRTRNEVFFVPLFHLWEGGGGGVLKPKMEISIFFSFEPFLSCRSFLKFLMIIVCEF